MARHEIKNHEIPNVSKATIKDFILLGINEPFELVGRDPYQMYSDLCKITNIMTRVSSMYLFLLSGIWNEEQLNNGRSLY